VISTERLPGGAVLLLEPVDRTDTVCIGFWFMQGSRDEEEGEMGFSHLLEHMLFKGTSRRSALAIAQEIDRVGGMLNAFTEKEAVCLHCTLPKDHLALAFDILADMSFHSILDESELAKEKSVIVNEIRASEDSPEECGHEKFLLRMWGSHPLARKITGEVSDVQEAPRSRLDAFYRRIVVPSGMIMAVAGNFDPGMARELALRSLPQGADAPFPQVPPVRSRRVRPEMHASAEFVPDKFSQVQIYAGTCYPLEQDIPHYYVSMVLSTAFGESMSSRLFQKIREELALCYAIYCFRSFYHELGAWTVYANTTPRMAAKLLSALDRELALLLRSPLSIEEIADAKSHLAGSMVLSREDMETRMKRLVRQFTMIGRALEFEESLSILSSVNAGDVDNLARTLVRSDSFNLLAYGTRGLARHAGFHFTF